jgi:AraC-like DNA-binding protein
MAGARFDLDPNIKTLLRDLGVPPTRLLRRAGLPADLLARGAVELPTAEYYRFWQALDEESGDRDLAVDIGRAISVEMFSPPIFAALCSPNLRVAAERIALYKPLIGPVRINVSSTAHSLTISYRWPQALSPPALLSTVELIFWVALARIGTREHVNPTRVTSLHRLAGAESLTAYLGTKVRRGTDYAVTFSAADAVRPFLTENDAMWRFFDPELRKRLADLTESASLTNRVQAALHETLPSGEASVTAITRQLAISVRTLQRQLAAEGTSFQALLAETRERLARHYLEHSSMRTTDIAYLLGYDDTNSFYRAFRTWTGTTPDTLRTQSRN